MYIIFGQYQILRKEDKGGDKKNFSLFFNFKRKLIFEELIN